MGYNQVGGAYDDYGKGDHKIDFVLLVVLFILLIIVGASFMKDHY